MRALDAQTLLDALRATGEAVARAGRLAPIRLVVTGGSAGMLAGWLNPRRATTDCDVVWNGDEAEWKVVSEAADAVGGRLDLAPGWLNRDSSMFAWVWPLGWQSRVELVGRFGALEVERLSRIDLIASKVMSCPKRPHDLVDVRDMHPTREELRFVEEHIDRIESEHLDRETFDLQRSVVRELRGAT